VVNTEAIIEAANKEEEETTREDTKEAKRSSLERSTITISLI